MHKMSLKVIKEAKMTKRPILLIGFILILAVAFVLAGCGSDKKETAGEEVTGVSTVGFTECYNCHSAEQNPSGLLEPFGWHESRHFNANDTPGFPLPDEECAQCHNELGDGELIEDFYAHTGNDIFGTENRAIVACESCHGPGGNHWGLGPLGNDLESPGVLFATCTKCHELGTFHPDDPTTISDRVITDTHIDDPATSDIEGYVLNPEAVSSDLPGNTNNGSCIDCHEQHTVDTTINNEWAESSHGGHIAEDGVVTEEDGPAWVHYDFKQEDRQACQMCHTATGFRNYANDPENYDPVNNVYAATGEQREMLYCWGCHYNNRGGLRSPGPAAGEAVLSFTIDDEPIVIQNVGRSAVCVVCHGGRGSVGALVLEDSRSSRFQGHHAPTAGIMFSAQTHIAYEYAGRNYLNPAFEHFKINQNTDGPCASCHMPGDSHTFEPVERAADGTITEIINQALCDSCHAVTPASLMAAKGGFDEAYTVLNNYVSNVEGFTNYLDLAITGSNYNDTAAVPNNAYGAYQNGKISGDEPCAYVHNPTYAKRIVFDSIDWMDDGLLNGVIDLTGFPEAHAWLNGGDPINAVTRP